MSTPEDRQTRKAKREAERKLEEEREEKERIARLEERRKRREEAGINTDVPTPENENSGISPNIADSEAIDNDILLEAEAIAQIELEQESEKETEMMLKELQIVDNKPTSPREVTPPTITPSTYTTSIATPSTNKAREFIKPVQTNLPIIKRTDILTTKPEVTIWADQESILEKKDQRKAWLESMMKGGVEEKRKDEMAKKMLDNNKIAAKEDQIKKKEKNLLV